jgi:hypothetical protein
MWVLPLLLISLAAAQSPVCRALALEGGGDKGAYEAGVLQAFAKLLDPEEITYDVVTGISVGALNAMLVVNTPIGQEAELADRMVDLWRWVGQTGSGAVFTNWNSLGIPYAIVAEPSLFSTAPLRNTTHVYFNVTTGIQRKFVIGTSDFNQGVLRLFNESIGVQGLMEVVMCSSAMPALFPYQNYSGTEFCDGGCILNLNIFSAVERCLEEVSDPSQVIVDSIFLTGDHLDPNASSYTTIGVMNRAKEINAYDSSMWYLFNALTAYPTVNFRYTVVPSKALPGNEIPLVFTTEAVDTMLAEAMSDVQTLIDGNGLNARDYATAYMQKRNSRRFK